MSKKPISVAEFFKDQRMEAVRMGEFTLHRDGQLERGGKKQPVGGIIISPDRKRFTVCDQHGTAVVTDLVEAVVPVYADPEVDRLRQAVKTSAGLLERAGERADKAERMLIEVQGKLIAANTRVFELEATVQKLTAGGAEAQSSNGTLTGAAQKLSGSLGGAPAGDAARGQGASGKAP